MHLILSVGFPLLGLLSLVLALASPFLTARPWPAAALLFASAGIAFSAEWAAPRIAAALSTATVDWRMVGAAFLGGSIAVIAFSRRSRAAPSKR